MYKVKHALCPQNICDLFTSACSPYNLRKTEFTLPRFNTISYEKHSLRYLGPKIWNMLPENLRKLHSIPTFKRLYKTIAVVTVPSGITSRIMQIILLVRFSLVQFLGFIICSSALFSVVNRHILFYI